MHTCMHTRLCCDKLINFSCTNNPHVMPINVQFLRALESDWKMARKQKKSPLHILEPVDLTVTFSRAMVVKDSRMAK